jgi:hypothetical protein
MIFADIRDGSNQFRHFFPNLGAIQSFDTVKRLVRKQFGSVELMEIGSIPDELLNTWIPPSPPEGFKFQNMKSLKFAFGRKRKQIVKARQDDFEE